MAGGDRTGYKDLRFREIRPIVLHFVAGRQGARSQGIFFSVPFDFTVQSPQGVRGSRLPRFWGWTALGECAASTGDLFLRGRASRSEETSASLLCTFCDSINISSRVRRYYLHRAETDGTRDLSLLHFSRANQKERVRHSTVCSHEPSQTSSLRVSATRE